MIYIFQNQFAAIVPNFWSLNLVSVSNIDTHSILSKHFDGFLRCQQISDWSCLTFLMETP